VQGAPSQLRWDGYAAAPHFIPHRGFASARGMGESTQILSSVSALESGLAGDPADEAAQRRPDRLALFNMLVL